MEIKNLMLVSLFYYVAISLRNELGFSACVSMVYMYVRTCIEFPKCKNANNIVAT